MQNVKLNLIPGSVMPVVNVSQYDKARQFSLTVYEGSATYSLTGKDVQIRGTKPDGNGFAYDSTDGVVSVSGSTVTISTTQQMTAVGGNTTAELRITSGTTIIGTLNFILAVENSALSDDTPISDTEIPAIERQLEAVLEEAEGYAEDAESWAVGKRDGQDVPSSDPAYQNNAKYYAGNAGTSATNADTNALKSEGYAVGKQNGTDVDSSSPYYHNNAKYFDNSAQNAYTQTRTARDAALTYKYGAEGWAVGTRDGQPVESSSPYYHNNADYYRSQASLSAGAAMSAAADGQNYKLESEGWAVGEQNGTPVTSGSPYYHNNAEWYKDQAAQYAAGGLIFKGSVAFASIPTTGMVNGDMYNITDDFTTDNRFIEGSGVSVKAGADIAWIDSVSKWDILALGGGTDSLSGLQDVTLTSPASGQVLEYDGSKWSNANLPTVPADLDDLGDVDLTTPTSGQFLKYDGSKWVNGSGGGGGASALDDLTDVSITTPADGDLLQYNGASQEWENNAEIPNAVAALEETGAVNIANCTAASQTNSGVTITKNSDNSYTLNGTSTAVFSLALTDVITFSKPAYLSGCTGGAWDKFALQYTNGTDVYWQYNDPVYMPTSYTNAKIFLLVRSGVTFNNTVIRPMISYAIMPYQPYAMTNRELTEIVESQPVISVKSGNATLNNCFVYKTGRLVQIYIKFTTTAAVNIGSDVVFNVANLPKPVNVCGLTGYRVRSIFVCKIENNNLYVRVLNENLTSGSDCYIYGTYITTD